MKFVLDWQIQGPQAPFIAAKTLGAFSGSGLDVTIDRGTGSQKTIELVATGTYDLGYGDINSMIEYNVKNPGNPLVGVYMVLNTPPFSLISLRKYGVKQPKDLKGFNIGAPAGDAPRRLWPIFAKNVGLPVDSVTWTNMAPPLREPALVKGDVKAISGFYFTGFLNLGEPEGPRGRRGGLPLQQVRHRPLRQCGGGADGLAQGERGHPARFVAGVNTGMKFTLKDPKAAIGFIKGVEPLVNEATELKRLELAISSNIINDEVKRDGLGGIDPKRMQRAIEQVVQSFELTSTPMVAQVFNGEFLPPVAVRKLS